MISDVFFPRINGVSTSIATFRRQLRREGHDVTLIAPAYPAGHEGESHILRIPSRYVVLDPEDRMMKARRIMAHADELAREGFDLIHVHTPFVAHHAGLALGRRLGIPVVESYHTYFEEYLFHYLSFLPRTWMRSVARHLSRRQCNQVDAVVVPSRAMAEILTGYGVKTPMSIIPTGIHQEAFAGGDGAAFRQHMGIDHDTPLLVHVGRIAFEKNIDALLHMMADVRRAIPDAMLVIAGDGPAMGHIRRLTGQLGLEKAVRFAGYLDRRTTLLDCYRAGNGFVFASRTETQGLVLLEAMALGVPVVSTAVMGTRDILLTGEGALVATDDRDLARQAIRLLSDPELQQTLSHQARQCAQDWSAPEMAARMLALYGAVSNGARVDGLSRDIP
ncbi:glycosyl transferase family 1 [Ectothiorhodospira shaposhnikovii]|nr:glycosyltransferase [Ectothiorhodospira shaposhnikovii]MBK1673064.1 glycosyl transferase family 1 [Ectothiorhodospira shaposhnikovii]